MSCECRPMRPPCGWPSANARSDSSGSAGRCNSRLMGILFHSQLMARLVLHDADDVVFGIGDLGDLTDVGNIDDSRAQLAAGGFDGRQALQDRAYGDRAAEAVERSLRGRSATLRDETVGDAGIGVRTGGNEVEIRRARDFECPAEDALVEFTGSLDVARENLE